MSYTIFSTNTSYPSQYPYQLIELTGNITLGWATSFNTFIAAAGYNEITTTQDGYVITLPDATLASEGVDVLFSNISAYNFIVNKSDGTLLYTVNSGVIVDLKLINNTTSAGDWRIIPFLGGYNGITSFNIESPDNTITITNGAVTPPGATINLQLPTSISNLNNVTTTGFPVIQNTSPLTWETRQLAAGNNINIINPDGITDNPLINLNDNLSGLVSAQIGNVLINGLEITTNEPDGSVLLTSDGEGYVILNNVTVDTNGNMVVNGNLTVTETFNNPLTPKVWCTFTDIITGESNDITIEGSSNVSTITGSNGVYTINFITSLSNVNNYGVVITLGTTGGPLPLVSHGFWTVREAGYVTISIVDASGELVSSVPNGATVVIMSV